jgi:hypothetical protein
MGVSSFLIRIDTQDDIINYLKYKKILAYCVMKQENSDVKFDDNYQTDENFTEQQLEEFNKTHGNKDFGDFDINLVGFKYWAGSIWGLVSTYTAGETAFLSYVYRFNKYYTRLWYIPYYLNYNQEKSCILSKYNNLSESLKLYNTLYDLHKDKILDYQKIFEKTDLIYKLAIDFNVDDVCKLLNIKYL